jgi:hypothetical protein
MSLQVPNYGNVTFCINFVSFRQCCLQNMILQYKLLKRNI